MQEAPDSPPEGTSPTAHHTQQANTGGKVNSDGNSNGNGNGNGGQKTNFGAPGSSYTTKKFNEEYEREESRLLDKNWDCSRYGDPLMDNKK